MFKMRRYVAMKSGFKIGENEIMEGTIVRIDDVEENGPLCLFPTGAQVVVPPEYLQVLATRNDCDEDAVKIALATIKLFEGHHTQAGQYQFNIKFHCWDWPKRLEDHFGQARMWDEYGHIIEDQYLQSVKKENCDSSIEADHDWINKTWQAGRSGGWLVVEHGVSYDDLAKRFADDQDALVNSDNLNDPGMAAEIEKGYKETCEEIVAFSIELLMIEQRIKHSLEGLELYIKSREPWEHLFEEMEENLSESTDNGRQPDSAEESDLSLAG